MTYALNAEDCTTLIRHYQVQHDKPENTQSQRYTYRERIAVLSQHAAFLNRKPYPSELSHQLVPNRFKAFGHCEKCMQQLANCKCHQQVQA